MDNKDFIFDKKAAALAEKALTENEHKDEFIKPKRQDEQPNMQEKEQIKDNETQQEGMLGKFKDPMELLKAYRELEKEFTRRSQRLKQLEASVKPYESEEEWKAAADKFFLKTPSAKALAKEMAEEIALDPSLKQGRDCFDRALVRALAKAYRTPEQLMADGQFLKDHVLNSKIVRKAIIEDFLKEIDDAKPPYTLSRGGKYAAAPPSRPRTVREAGNMLLRENK